MNQVGMLGHPDLCLPPPPHSQHPYHVCRQKLEEGMVDVAAISWPEKLLEKVRFGVMSGQIW